MLLNLDFPFLDSDEITSVPGVTAAKWLGGQLKNRCGNLHPGSAWDWCKALLEKGIIDITSGDQEQLEQFIKAIPFTDHTGMSFMPGETLIKAQLLKALKVLSDKPKEVEA